MEEYQLMCLKSAQMSITWTNNIFSSSAIVVAACVKIHRTKKRSSTQTAYVYYTYKCARARQPFTHR